MARAKYTADIIRKARTLKKQVDSLVDESSRLGCGPPDWRPFVSELAAMVEALASTNKRTETRKLVWDEGETVEEFAERVKQWIVERSDIT